MRAPSISPSSVQAGDPIPTPFSFRTKAITQPQTVCWITYTNAETHRVIRENVIALRSIPADQRHRTALLPLH